MNRKIIIVILLILSVWGVSYSGGNMNKGTRLYEKQDFNGAVENFLKEHSKKPKDPVVNYNLASAYYKSGDFDKAFETYEKTSICLNILINRINKIKISSKMPSQ
jgi:tetratricopeptide (TPR) repeat protein